MTLRTAALMSVTLALAVACARPPAAPSDDDIVPQATVGRDVVEGWTRVDDLYVSPPLATGSGATRVSFLGRVVEDGEVALYAKAEGADAWLPAETTWRDDVVGKNDRFVARVDLGAVVDSVVVAVAASDLAALRSLTYEAVVPQTHASSSSSSRPAVTSTRATQTAALLDGYQPRSAWGARAPSGCDDNTTKTKITVHHTVQRLNAGATRDEFAAEIRADQVLHMDGRGYCDIAYHFLVSADGTVWEGRDQNFLGAHTGGQNTNNLGVSFIGCFHPTSDCDGMGSTTPPQAMIDGAGAFIGTAARHYGIALNVGTTLLGHRDNPGQSTACPGDNLHDRLGDLKAIADDSATPTPTTGTVQGIVWDLAVTENAADADTAGATLVGARVAAMQGTTEVASSTSRAGDAYWSLDLAPGAYTLQVTLEGYAAATRSVNIASGDDRWASIGLTPDASAVDVTFAVVDAVTGAAIAGAGIDIAGQDPQVADAAGRLVMALPPGPISVTAHAEGYAPRTQTATATLGTPLNVLLALNVAVDNGNEGEGESGEGEGEGEGEGDDKGEGEGEGDVDDGPDRVVIRTNAAPGVSADSGCGGCAQGDATPWMSVAAVAVLRQRRRRR